MGVSNASGSWKGSLKEGGGVMKPATAPALDFGLATRFEGAAGTNPEELIGAALCGCFSMALTLALSKEGHAPRAVETRAAVHLDKQGDGFTITRIALETTVDAPDLDDATFQRVAEATKKGCPVSKALAGPEISLQAVLREG